ncbi:hypothetical protein [Methylobacterium sp. JK268]
MQVLKAVEVPFPFDAVIRKRGGRELTRAFYAWASATVPVVRDVEAPVILLARGVRTARDREPHGIAWRAWRGHHWRPVLDDLGKPQLVDAEDFTCDPPRSGRSYRWIDHPCGLRFGERFVSGPDALGFWSCETEDFLLKWDRVVGGNRGEAASLATAVAAEEMAQIDGVLHKRAELPMWSLGWSQDLDVYDGEVSLVVPDFGGRAPPSLGLVPLTHLDLAKQAAEGLVRYGGGDPRLAKPPDPSSSVEVVGTVNADEAVVHTLLHAREMFDLVSAGKPYEAEPSVGPALGRMRDSLDRLREAPVADRAHHCGLAVTAIGRALQAMETDARPRRDLMAILTPPIRVADRCRNRPWGDPEEAETPGPGR